MNAIIGFSQLLLKNDLAQEKREEYVNIVCQSGTNLLNIIEDVLKIASLETGQEKVRNTECRLGELMHMLDNQFKRKIEAKNLNFIVDIPSGREIVFKTDKTKLTQILSNLLNNALKFTREGFIRFGCRPEKELLRFYVEDSGIGIHPEHISKIFERFYQVESNLSREYGGTGLGLSISKAYAEMLGGKIWAESVPGKGSVFYVTIPFHQDEKPLTENSAEITAIPAIQDALVLLVEDDDYNYLLVREMLSGSGIRLHRVSTGQEAIEVCRQKSDIRLVLMDIKLPDMDGYEVTRIIKGIRKDVPVVALTAYALQDDEEKARLAGCSEYLAKPLNRQQFNKILAHYLS
jgi:CheY-like chemotaxis protein